MTKLPLSALTLDAVQAEAVRAHLKHGPMSLLNPEMPWSYKLAALMEEVGEVARELTYDGGGYLNGPRPLGPSDAERRDCLVKELIQVASVALTWVESLEGDGSR
jgi:hypothetical protein